jgi:hypothetical protein
MLAGALQLIPGLRDRCPVFPRWNGRIYTLAAVTISTAGLYLTWVRGSIGNLSQHIGGSLNAVLIWLCAAMALRYAVGSRFQDSSPLGSSLVPGGKCGVVLPGSIFLLVTSQ